MYANGHGSSEIVQFLNKNNYLSPTGYRKTGAVQDKEKINYCEATRFRGTHPQPKL